MSWQLQTTVASVLPLALVLFVAGAQGQVRCGTRVTPEYADLARYLESVGRYQSSNLPDRFVPNIPVDVHIVQRANGSGGIDPALIPGILDEANQLWQAMGIQFFAPDGGIDLIMDDGLYDLSIETELPFLFIRNTVPNQINIYFVNEITSELDPDTVICGIASFSYVPVQGIAISGSSDCDSNLGAVLAHELGHYFDLYHTHETFWGEECPDGSNCTTTGDLLCDTAADPGLDRSNVNSDCEYTGDEERCGDSFTPDPSNIMSYSRHHCLVSFTSGQRSRALATLANARGNLVDEGNPTLIWVDFAAGSVFPNGDFTNPHIRLVDGLAAVSAGGRVVLKGGHGAESGVFGQPALLDSFLGSAIVGQ